MENTITTGANISSREIAQITGTQHKNVMRSIRKMEAAWTEVSGASFTLGSYKDNSNRNQPMYLLKKDESLFISTKFNDVVRAKLVLRWKELEGEEKSMDFSNPDTVLMLAQNWKDEMQKRELAEAKVKELAPKAELASIVIERGASVNVGQAAKLLQLGFGRNTLHKRLRDLGVWFRYRNEPKQKYIDAGLFEIKESVVNRDGEPPLVTMTALVTQKGLTWLNQHRQELTQITG